MVAGKSCRNLFSLVKNHPLMLHKRSAKSIDRESADEETCLVEKRGSRFIQSGGLEPINGCWQVLQKYFFLGEKLSLDVPREISQANR